jgi:tRNA A-37 threonylcarbamoyl transferase component Bud32/tetratricopeptide (TPR) repeat protein
MTTPEKIGKYQIVAKIGQGAMGEVFRAHDPVLSRDVAVKRISAGLDADEMVRKRFQREAQAVALLSHPHIVTVYELGFEGDHMFMAMELLEGKDLKHAIANRRMTLDEKLSLMEQIAEGLAFAHARDIVHRDLKPANIHILPGDKVKVMDFGLARMPGSDMTSTGTVMGTPHYMSPEQVRGQKADARSDVFALGCICYELLSGKKPFDAESMHGVLFKVMQEEPAPLIEINPGLPHVLVQLIERALAKDPAERFQNAGEMLAALRQTRLAVGGSRGHERGPEHERAPGAPAPARASRSGSDRGSRIARQTKPPTPEPSGHRTLLLGAAAALVVLGLAGWALRGYLSERPAAAPSQAPEVRNLAQAVIDTQVELARRRLEAGDYADAARKAEGALKLDPSNAAAREVLDAAGLAVKKTDQAIAAIQAAGSDRERLAAAAFDLMTLDPGHPEAEKAAAAAGPAFRPRAEEARRLERQERQKAEQAGAERTSSFAQAVDLERQGDRALEAGQTANAARRFLEARARFEQARPGSR